MTPPTAAPANISSTEATRLRHRGLVPPASEESAAKPIIVRVKTAVVRSGTPSLRVVAFLNPIARAVSPITPRNKTLPVMFAVNTCPNAKRLTASTIPVVAVMPRRM
jgi:hypothetical protein